VAIPELGTLPRGEPLRSSLIPAALRDARAKRCLVILSQAYVPDPAAVGQYLHDVAVAMVQRDYRVVVFTADRGYEDPTQHHPRYECIDGVHVVRLPLSSFGKRSLVTRLLGGSIFVSEAAVLAASLPRIDHLLVSTSPPMCALAGIALRRLRGAPLTFWAMDINPDQIVATGKLHATALPVRAFDWMNRQTLAHAQSVVVLDRFMATRLQAKLDIGERLRVLPLWPLFEPSASAAQSDNGFRREHGLGDKRVVMYSGNLSPVHPIATLLEAMRALTDDPRLLFMFVGGGQGRDDIARFVREHNLANVRLLDYQPLADLPVSLTAADLQLVVMGDAMVGIVHPSKIYTALAAGRPILALGPRRSHVGELVERHDLGWRIDHGDVAAATSALREFARAAPTTLAELGRRSRALATAEFAKEHLLGQFCDWLEPVSS
jgi:colanic acid biosynthesis glycosyl transferase WcaI